MKKFSPQIILCVVPGYQVHFSQNMGKFGITKYFTISSLSLLPYNYCPTSCLLEKPQCVAEYCDMMQF